MPFFSIIVASFNAADTIGKTISSVLAQSFGDFEIIVKDAASTDNTLAQIPQDDRIHIYSEKDHGIYDGMNAALDHASGQYVQFLNCGDILADDRVLETVHAALLQKPFDIIYGDIRKFGKPDKQIRRLSRRALCRTTICHQAIFYKKEIFDTVGKYDTTYLLCADREHLLRLYNAGCSSRFIHTVICEYLGNGASESQANAAKMHEEDARIQKEYFTERERNRCQRGRNFKRFVKKILKRR